MYYSDRGVFTRGEEKIIEDGESRIENEMGKQGLTEGLLRRELTR
jgi:hypothetical protein